MTQGIFEYWVEQASVLRHTLRLKIFIAACLGLCAFNVEAQTKQGRSSVVGVPRPPGHEQEKSRLGAATIEFDVGPSESKVGIGRQAIQKRDEAIVEAEKLLGDLLGPEKAEMQFRLAELYWEKFRNQRTEAFDSFEKAYRAWSESKKKEAEPKLPSYLRKANQTKKKAISLYESILKTHPNYARNDEVNFYLGYSAYQAGSRKSAVRYYETVVKKYPQSKLLPDVYLQLGEYYFANNDLNRAQKYFERASATKEQRVYHYALYKLAWCDYNRKRYRSGINKLKSVVSASAKPAVSSDGRKQIVQLKDEALNDLSRFFVEVGEVQGAIDYFRSIGQPSEISKYVGQLGENYSKLGKWRLSIDVFRSLLRWAPLDQRAPYFQASIVEAYSRLNERPLVRREVNLLVDNYKAGSAWNNRWKNQGSKSQDLINYAYELAEGKLRVMVVEYHRDAKRRKNVETYRLARDIYAKYLEVFFETTYAYDMRYKYAEVLWALDEWRNAALQYRMVAQQSDKATNKGSKFRNHATEAAYNQILAWERVAQTGKSSGELQQRSRVKEKRRKGRTVAREATRVELNRLDEKNTYEPRSLTELEKNLSDACDLYFSIADPGDPDLPAIKYKAAFLYYKHNRFVESAERFFEIIERWPRSKLSKRSAYRILDSLNVQKQWDELAKYADSFASNQGSSRCRPAI